MNSMNDTTADNGDEAEDPASHLQEVVDEVDLESATEEDPLTLDPSTSSIIPTLSPYTDPLTRYFQHKTHPSSASARYPPSLPGPSRPTNPPAASTPSATSTRASSGNRTARNRTCSRYIFSSWSRSSRSESTWTSCWMRATRLRRCSSGVGRACMISWVLPISLHLNQGGERRRAADEVGIRRFSSTNGAARSRAAGWMSISRASAWEARPS